METHELPIYMPYCVIHYKVYELVSSSALISAIAPMYQGRRAKESKVTLPCVTGESGEPVPPSRSNLACRFDYQMTHSSAFPFVVHRSSRDRSPRFLNPQPHTKPF